MYLVRIPRIIPLLFADATFSLPGSRAYYLSFDDGPDPVSTPILLQLLDEFNIKATFFLLASRAKKYPGLVASIRAKGHTIGNHGFHHISGWSTPTRSYIENAEKGAALLKTDLFRPPYGRLTPVQYTLLKARYQIILWNLMPGDFDNRVSNEQCLRRLQKHLKPGSIVVWHDQEDGLSKLAYCLRRLDTRIIDNFKGLPQHRGKPSRTMKLF